MAIVTRESIQNMLNNPNPDYVKMVVGRALVAIFNNQTESEKTANSTDVDNGIGFSGADARSGTLTAKSYMKNRTLQDWQVERWTKPGRNGFARLTKYAKQLNTIAEMKAAQKV